MICLPSLKDFLNRNATFAKMKEENQAKKLAHLCNAINLAVKIIFMRLAPKKRAGFL